MVGDLLALATEPSQPEIYDRPVGVRLLHQDPRTGAEHWLVRYPAGLVERWHRHSAAHTVVVLEGALDVDGVRVGVGGWCHFPAGSAMHHVPGGRWGLHVRHRVRRAVRRGAGGLLTRTSRAGLSTGMAACSQPVHRIRCGTAVVGGRT